VTRPRPGSLASRLGPEEAIVLVVEDEPDIASFLSAFFRASGTEVVHLDPASADEVVERAAALHVACALVDLNLSGLSGFDVLEAFAADERVADLPVIIVTADARPATQERAAALGAVGFVPKPFNVKDVFTAVQALVQEYQTRAAGPTVIRPRSEPKQPAAPKGRASYPPPPPPPELTHPVVHAPLLSADAVSARLAAVVDDGATFALVRLAGAAASPAVVGEVARRIVEDVKAADVLGATAADELAVLFAGQSPADVQDDLLGALGHGRLSVELGRGRVILLDVRIGIAASPTHATTGEELYMAADVALADAIDASDALVVAR